MIRQGKITTVTALGALACMLTIGAPAASAIPTVKSTFVFTKVDGDSYTGKVKSKVSACVRSRTVVFKRGATTIATKKSSRNGTVVLTPGDQLETPFELAHVAMPKKKIGRAHKRFCSADTATIDKRGDEKPVSFGTFLYDLDRTFDATISSPEFQCQGGRLGVLYQDATPRGSDTSDGGGYLVVTLVFTPLEGSWTFKLTDDKRWVKITRGGDVNSGPCETDISSNAIDFG